MSDTAPSRSRKISHPGVRALTKLPPLPVHQSLPLTHNSDHTLSTSSWAESIRELKKNDREVRIQQAIQERTTKGSNLHDPVILYNIPRSTLSGRLQGIPPRHEAQKKQQALPPAVEQSLVYWIDDMDTSGFPPRLGLFNAVANNGGPHLVSPG